MTKVGACNPVNPTLAAVTPNQQPVLNGKDKIAVWKRHGGAGSVDLTSRKGSCVLILEMR